jgi:hypothetical protein
VKTDTQDPPEGRQGTQTDDNVVRLPREWLGLREDLVEIGTGAAAAGPPAPEDFWGEGSSDLQSALVGAPTAPPTDPTPRRRVPPWLGPARTPTLVTIATAAVALAILVISALGAQLPERVHQRIASVSHAHGKATDGGFRFSRGVQSADARHLVPRSRAHGPVRQRSHAARRRPLKSHRAAPRKSTPQTSVTSSSSSNPSPTYGDSSSVSSNSSQIASGSAAQVASAQPSQPAFGANGSLGPGRGASNTQ